MLRPAIEATAAASAAFGVVAVVTGASWAALLAGLTAVLAAGLVLRLVTDPATDGGGLADPGDDDALEPLIAHDLPRVLPAGMIQPALESCVAAARRAGRPFSVVIVELSVVAADRATAVAGDVIARAADTALREADLVGRVDDGVYVLLLEDTGEDGAVWTAERLRRHVRDAVTSLRFVAGVATCPDHALDAAELRGTAERALDAAREWGRDRIEVAGTI